MAALKDKELILTKDLILIYLRPITLRPTLSDSLPLSVYLFSNVSVIQF